MPEELLRVKSCHSRTSDGCQWTAAVCRYVPFTMTEDGHLKEKAMGATTLDSHWCLQSRHVQHRPKALTLADRADLFAEHLQRLLLVCTPLTACSGFTVYLLRPRENLLRSTQGRPSISMNPGKRSMVLVVRHGLGRSKNLKPQTCKP